MRALNSHEIYGTWSTLLLPINTDDSIDFVRLADQLDTLLSSGVNGIYCNGTACEFYAQSEDEFDQISLLLAERCERHRLPFQIGASHTNAQTSLERVRRAAQLKPSAIQVILPDWVSPNVEEVIMFLQRVGESTGDIKLVLYNPPNAKRVLTPKDYGRVAREVSSLAGIKVLDGDASWYAEMRSQAPHMALFVPGHHLATGKPLGASGSYSNVACISPWAACRWYRMIEEDHASAMRIEASICKFLSENLNDDLPNAAKDKLLAAIGGWSSTGTRLRWPYRWYDDSVVERLRVVAHKTMGDFFDLAKTH